MCDRIAALISSPAGVNEGEEQAVTTAEVGAAATDEPEAMDAAEGQGQATDARSVSPSSASAQIDTSCPKGLTYDPYPGRRRLYVDADGDGYCDHSVPQNS